MLAMPTSAPAWILTVQNCSPLWLIFERWVPKFRNSAIGLRVRAAPDRRPSKTKVVLLLLSWVGSAQKVRPALLMPVATALVWMSGCHSEAVSATS